MNASQGYARFWQRRLLYAALPLFLFLCVPLKAQRMMPFAFWQSGVFEAGTMPAVRLEAPKDSVIQTADNGGTASQSARIGIDVLASAGSQSTVEVFQPFPNPFGAASASGASTTSIRIRLPGAARVTVHLYSILGQPIATLFDDVLPAGACALRVIPPVGLSGGTYFVGLASGTDSRLLRIVYLR